MPVTDVCLIEARMLLECSSIVAMGQRFSIAAKQGGQIQPEMAIKGPSRWGRVRVIFLPQSAGGPAGRRGDPPGFHRDVFL